MHSPFEKDTKEDIFFLQITDAINNWMLEKYPLFDTRLDNKIKELEILQNEFKLLINDFRLDTRNIRQQDANAFKDEINKFLKKDYPDISSGTKKMLTMIRNKQKKIEEREFIQERKLNDKLNEMHISQTLSEDVYKMREEFKKMNVFMVDMLDIIKKIFEP